MVYATLTSVLTMPFRHKYKFENSEMLPEPTKQIFLEMTVCVGSSFT